jgi:protein-S-isoprenylcysteine O-methyltransferase Ste14
MPDNLNNIINILIAWLAYFALHSALASLAVKHWVAVRWPHFSPHYRLTYNLAATLLLIPPLWLLHSHQAAAPLWHWDGTWRWLMDGLALAAGVGFVWSLRYYDMREFLGLRQPFPTDQGTHLSLSPLHRIVRHPWYFFGLVIIWTRDMDPAWLASCVAISLYFAVGSRLEEHKLVMELGEPYRRYRQRVPGLIPLPGRYLSRAEAEALIAATQASNQI